MLVNLSVKNVPDSLADRLRSRAERNRRSLQRELLSILESAAGDGPPPGTVSAPGGTLTIGDLVARTSQLFPRGTASSTAFIRAMRDGR